MYSGHPTLCLKVADIARSQRFYEALGLSFVEGVEGQRAILRRGHFTLALMTFLERDVLNFRGADAFEVHAAMKATGIDAPGEPENYTTEDYDADAAGTCWFTQDPDGHEVMLDTNTLEQGDAYRDQRVREILAGTEQSLMDVGADAACLEAFRTEVLAKFG